MGRHPARWIRRGDRRSRGLLSQGRDPDAPWAVTVWTRGAQSGFGVGKWRVEFRRGRPLGYRSPSRTRIHSSLLDVASTHDAFDTAATITSAFSRRAADPGRLLLEVESRLRQRHRAMIEALCDPSTQGVHSLIEWLFLRDVVCAHGLPEPSRQVGKVAGRVDAFYDEYLTIVELDGMRDHSDWSKDMIRDNEHLLEDGSPTLRYGLNAVMGDPCRASRQVGRRLRSQGWRGVLRVCSACDLAQSVDLTTDFGGQVDS